LPLFLRKRKKGFAKVFVGVVPAALDFYHAPGCSSNVVHLRFW